MNFKIEDVQIDVFTTSGRHTYRMTHKPSGAVVIGMGDPTINNRQKQTLLDELKAQVAKVPVKNVAKKQPKQKP